MFDSNISQKISFRLAFGNESGLAIVDYVQRTCLLNLGTPDLYGKGNPAQGCVCIEMLDP